MFKKGRRWTLVLFASLLPVLAPILAVSIKYFSLPLRYAAALIVGIFVFGFSLNYLAVIKPVKDVEIAFHTALDVIGGYLQQIAKSDGIDVRVNVMLARWSWKHRARCLEIVWSLGMDKQPDVRACIPLSKGAAGESFRTKLSLLVNFVDTTNEDFGFTAEEIKKYHYDDLSAVLSIPIYALDSKNRGTDKVIGVVNMDTRDKNGYAVIATNAKRYEDLLDGIGDCVSRIAS